MSIEHDLLHMPVRKLDLSEYTTVRADATVREVVNTLRQDKHNCAFVLDDELIVGIFTDADVLHRVVDHPDTWDAPITTVMTERPSVITSDDPTMLALDLMAKHSFRNMPVRRAGTEELVGNLTHFSIIRYLAEKYPEQTYNLPPADFGSDRYGG